MTEKKSFAFIANSLVIKNNKGLKNRDQFGVELEAERTIFHAAIGLEAYPNDTHFLVTIEPIIEESTPTYDDKHANY